MKKRDVSFCKSAKEVDSFPFIIEPPYVVVEVAPQLLGRGVCFCKLASIVRAADFSCASLIGRNKYARNIVVRFCCTCAFKEERC